MLNHVVELFELLRMALLHGGYDIHHSTPGLCCSQMTALTKKNEFGDVVVIKTDTTTIRPAIFSHLEPNDVFEAPRFHRLKPPRQKRIWAPKVEMRFLGGDRISVSSFAVLSFCKFEARREFRMNKIFVTVSGGCAYVMEDTVPQGFSVEVIDFDNISAGDSFPSAEAREYCAEHDLYHPPRTLQG